MHQSQKSRFFVVGGTFVPAPLGRGGRCDGSLRASSGRHWTSRPDEHGHVLNRAMFARELRLSIPTVKTLLRGMESMGWIRLLPALRPEGADRCFRKPRIQITSASLLARILGPRHERPGLPRRFLMERHHQRRAPHRSQKPLHALWRLRTEGTRPGRCAPGASRGLSLCRHWRARLARTMPLRRAIRSGAVNKGFVLHTGDRCFFCARRVLAVPAQLFLARYEDFTIPHEHPDPWFLLCRWVNGAFTGMVPVESIVPRSPLGGLDPDLLRLLRRL